MQHEYLLQISFCGLKSTCISLKNSKIMKNRQDVIIQMESGTRCSKRENIPFPMHDTRLCQMINN